MYQASSAFHTAVANNAPQMALLVFSDAIFTNSDIDVDAGIEMDDYFNTETDIAIGQALSNEIRFSLFNDDRLLNDYEFGEFTATVGAYIGTDVYQQRGPVMVTTQNASYIGNNAYPFLLRNNTPVSSQPGFAVKSMLAYNEKLMAFSGDGRYAVYDDRTGANITAQNRLNAFMRDKSTKLNGKGIYYSGTSRILFIYDGGYRDRYEFVPFGKFIAKRPNVPDVNQISMVCHDFMTKFDKDMPAKEELGISYPITIGELFEKLCKYVNVEYVTSTFINSTATITKEPEEFENATMREVMQWIAEAGASNLRFNRDGKMVFDWIRATGTQLTENDYVDYAPFWYETTQVDKLYNRDSGSGNDMTVGTGNIGYLIQDNPLLKGVS